MPLEEFDVQATISIIVQPMRRQPVVLGHGRVKMGLKRR